MVAEATTLLECLIHCYTTNSQVLVDENLGDVVKALNEKYKAAQAAKEAEAAQAAKAAEAVNAPELSDSDDEYSECFDDGKRPYDSESESRVGEQPDPSYVSRDPKRDPRYHQNHADTNMSVKEYTRTMEKMFSSSMKRIPARSTTSGHKRSTKSGHKHVTVQCAFCATTFTSGREKDDLCKKCLPKAKYQISFASSKMIGEPSHVCTFLYILLGVYFPIESAVERHIDDTDKNNSVNCANVGHLFNFQTMKYNIAQTSSVVEQAHNDAKETPQFNAYPLMFCLTEPEKFCGRILMKNQNWKHGPKLEDVEGGDAVLCAERRSSGTIISGIIDRLRKFFEVHNEAYEKMMVLCTPKPLIEGVSACRGVNTAPVSQKSGSCAGSMMPGSCTGLPKPKVSKSPHAGELIQLLYHKSLAHVPSQECLTRVPGCPSLR